MIAPSGVAPERKPVTTRQSAAREATNDPAYTYRPKMVEYQVGWSDISQSNEAKVKVKMKSSIPPGDHRRMRSVSAGSPVSSWRTDQLRSSQVQRIQQPK